jgi:hypothetical protein
MVLLHDLKWKWNHESVNGNLVEELRGKLTNWRGSEGEADPPNGCPGWAVLDDGSQRKHLPMPDFKTFQELDRFLYVWNSKLESFGNLENTAVEKLTDLWALAGWIVFNNRYQKFAVSGTAWFEKQLITFKEDKAASRQSQDWLRDIKDWLKGIETSGQTTSGHDQPPPAPRRRLSRVKP